MANPSTPQQKFEPKTEAKEPAPTPNADELARKAEWLYQFFTRPDLSSDLQMVTKQYQALAGFLIDTVARNPERTIALRHLLDSLEAALRGMIGKPTPGASTSDPNFKQG